MKKVAICLGILVVAGGIFFMLNTSGELNDSPPAPVSSVLKTGGRSRIVDAEPRPKLSEEKTTATSENGDVINFATIEEDVEKAMEDEDFNTAVKLVRAQLNRTNDPEKICELLDTLSNAGLKGLGVITKYMDVREKEVRDHAIELWRQEIDLLDESKEKTALIDMAGKTVAEDELSDADAVQTMIDTLFDVSEDQALQSVLGWLKVAKGKEKVQLLMEDISFRTAEDFSSENLSQSQAVREAEAMIKKYLKEMKE